MVDQVHQLQGKLELIPEPNLGGDNFAIKFDNVIITFDNALEMSVQLERAASVLRGIAYAKELLATEIPDAQKRVMMTEWEEQAIYSNYKKVYNHVADLYRNNREAERLYLAAGDNCALGNAVLAFYFRYDLTETEVDILTAPYRKGRNA